MAPTSRREFLTGLTAGAAIIGATWGIERYRAPRLAAAKNPVPECCGYVEYGGWIVTKADKERLTAAGAVRRLDSTSLSGSNFADQLMVNADACEAWCLDEPDCQGFTFAKPSHPDVNVQNRCWLKNTSQVTPVPDPRFTSGVR